MAETVLLFAMQAMLLFGAAGRFDWPMAWAFLFASLVLAATAFRIVDRDLVEERALPGPGIQHGDVILSSVGFLVLHPLALLVAGLDRRFLWSPRLPLALRLGALAAYLAGSAVGLWAMHENRFFSSFVRIQTERGHRVVTSGPYAYVRHPGYGGGILGYALVPLALGSLWALLPACVGAGLFAIRTAREDRLLRARLDGYIDYAARVRWRWLPGIW